MSNHPSTQIEAHSAFDFVLFGGTGDLAMRKLLPSLYYLHHGDMLHQDGRIIAVARSQLSREDFLARVFSALQDHVAVDYFSDELWQAFAQRIHYLGIDLDNIETYQPLADLLDQVENHSQMFYLSTGANLFAPICLNLHKAGIITERSRVADEKPLGRDLESAKEISSVLRSAFNENQIYRIDHYLGK